MTDIASITSSTAATAITSAASNSKAMGKDEFLQLMVAQLQNQDPLDPQDPTAFTAQLAQYSSLEQQITMNSNMEKMVESSANFERLTALGLIGKEVAGESSTVRMNSATVAQEISDALGYIPGELDGLLGYRLESAAGEVTLNVMDETGNTVATFQEYDVEAGAHRLAWDSKDKDGNYLPPGEYSMKASAKGVDAAGEDVTVDVSPFIISTVLGVELDPSGSLLETSAGRVALADVTTFMEY
jgi:flagellar basal-body rod modification protein FlgD